MKSKFITHIIIEGCDGVGKDSIMAELWPMYNFQYRVLMRGELSDFVYAKKYNREFISTQRGLPFLYVLLIKDKKQIKQQIINRGIDVETELKKLNDQDLFIKYADILKQDYHIIIVNVDNLNIKQAAEKVYKETIKYINDLKIEDEPNEFNKMYIKGSERLGLKWTVRNNQPFLNGKMIMADAQLHNGRFETYDDKTIPHNLIFSLGYDYICTTDIFNRKIDFAYPINSKILVRKEIYNYIENLNKNGLTLLTTDSKYIPELDNIIRADKVFGDKYISLLTQAKATFYCSRDLAYLEMMTVRCYEAVRANQIIFVDIKTDPLHKILKQIHGAHSSYIRLLMCDEKSLPKKYKKVMASKIRVQRILQNQKEWYTKLCMEVTKNAYKLK